MSLGSKPRPLIGVPARQAHDLHKGVVYQIWHSVEAWINLTEGEFLVLEGAEDFDVLTDDSGTTVQIKATAVNMTLRSKAVISALNNFWRVKSDQPNRNISLRFITTSSIAVEKGNPFGGGVKGMCLWRNCAETGDITTAEQIRHFLVTDSTVSPQLNHQITGQRDGTSTTLLGYLKSADATAFLNSIVKHIIWETDAGDSDVIKESVGIYLRAYGERFGTRPTDCEPAIDRLFRAVAEAASKKNHNILSRDDFRRTFEEATTKRYSTSEIASFRLGTSRSPAPVIDFLADGAQIALSALTLVQSGIPELPPHIVSREIVVNEMAKRMEENGIIVTGSSGMGKSTLANLLASDIGGNWRWADFQGLEPNTVPQIVRLLAQQLVASDTAFHLALDNLHFSPEAFTQIDNSLAALARSIRNRKGQLIITTQTELPERFLNKLLLTKTNVINVPRFTEDEVEKLCEKLGCPPQNRSTATAKVILYQTGGHPQLVHARLTGLSAQGWPSQSAEDIMGQPPELIQERDIARQLLNDAQPSDKELLYRLSIATGYFRKDHALAIANLNPPLAFAGDAFTRMVGPWIEKVGTEYYRLSPLLANAAQNNWPADDILQLRSSIARAILSCKNKTLLEASEVLMQGLISKDEQAVFAVAVGLVQAPFDANTKIADQLSWLTPFGYKNGKMIFPENSTLNVFLRILQFRIQVERFPDDVDWLCEAIDREKELAPAKSGTMLKTLWFTHALYSTEAAIQPERLIKYWIGNKELLAKDVRFAREAEKTMASMNELGGFPQMDFLGHQLTTILMRMRTAANLLGLLKAIEALPGEDKVSALDRLRGIPIMLNVVLGRLWLGESDSSNPDWHSILNCYATIEEIARKWDFPALAALCCLASAVVEDEYLSQPSEAQKSIDRGIAYNSNQSYRLENQKAWIFCRQLQYSDAIQIWLPILSNWRVIPNSHEFEPIFACHRAGNAAGKISEWRLAAGFFEEGRGFAQKLGSPLYDLAFSADRAFTQWKLGERQTAIEDLAVVLCSLELLEIPEEDEAHFHRVWKSVEHLIKWFWQDSSETFEPGAKEPDSGICSMAEDPPGIREIVKMPADLSWSLLAQTEFRLGRTREIFDRAVVRVFKGDDSHSRLLMARLRISVNFRETEFSSLVELVGAFHEEYIKSKSQFPESDHGGGTVSLPDLFSSAVIAAFVKLTASGRTLDQYNEIWSSAVEKLQGATDVGRILGDVKITLAGDTQGIHRIYQDTTMSQVSRWVAALRMAVDTDNSLQAMLVGQVSVLRCITSGGFRNEVSSAFGIIVKETWMKRIGFPAEFPTPRITIPPLIAACNDGTEGIKLAARILLRARFAVTAERLPPKTIQRLEELAL